MRKYIFAAVTIFAIAIYIIVTHNPIDACPEQVQKIAMEFANHAEAKITAVEFVKSEPSLTGKVVRHYWDVTFRQGQTSRTRRISLPVDEGTICAANFVN
jgi:hypothetical protein